MAGAVQTMLREVMDIRQAAEYLGISGDTLYRYASEGFVPAFKLGNRWRFKRSLLDAWMVEKSGGARGAGESTPIAVMPKQKKRPGGLAKSQVAACFPGCGRRVNSVISGRQFRRNGTPTVPIPRFT
jgi:excisionase family DNA binding protein